MAILQDIRDNFQFLEDWEDRYKYLIELGRALPPYPEQFRTDAYKVRGCASQVWLQPLPAPQGGTLSFTADSDAHIVRGLIALVLSLYNDKTAQEILAIDANAVFHDFQLSDHLTSQRTNGLAAMVARIRAYAQDALQN